MPSQSRLTNKVALITGGTSGIGRATAMLFAQEGAQVVFTGRRVAHGHAVLADIRAAGGDAQFVVADHTQAVDCEKVVQAALAHYGRLDILFNNAGIVVSGTAESVTEGDWERTLALNVTAVWRMCRLVLPILRAQGGGVIVNNASDWGLVGAANFLAYCTSKGAVVQMTRAMALDHAHEHIRVNAICPGDTLVERWVEQGTFRGASPVTDAVLAAAGADLPLRRLGHVDEIARAVLFLASDESSFMTGAALAVDGGNTAR